MHSLKALVLAGLGALALYGLGAASTVQAAPPDKATFTFTDSGVVTGCGSFVILAQYEVRITEQVFFDRNGVPVRLQFHGIAFGTMTNSSTGYTVKDAPSVRNGFVDFITGTRTFVGVDFHVTVPGHGVVLLQAGRIVFDPPNPQPVFIAGPHLGPPPDQAAALCAALNH